MSLPSGVGAELRQQKQFWYTLSQKNVSGDKHFNSFSGNQNDRLYFTIMVEAYNTFKSEQLNYYLTNYSNITTLSEMTIYTIHDYNCDKNFCKRC